MDRDRVLGVVDVAVGASAIGGAAYALGGATAWPVEWLEGTPLRSYRVPGLVLGFVHAPLDLAAGVAALAGAVRRLAAAREQPSATAVPR